MARESHQEGSKAFIFLEHTPANRHARFQMTIPRKRPGNEKEVQEQCFIRRTGQPPIAQGSSFSALLPSEL